jgi:adenosylhomocysteine nucleosidase
LNEELRTNPTFATETRPSSPLTVGIVVAMEHEFNAVREELLSQAAVETIDCSQVVQGVLDSVHYVIFQSGIGTTNAAAGACDLITRFRPCCLLNLGTTALISDPERKLRIGDVLVGELHQQWDLDLGGPITSTWTAKRSYVDVLQTDRLRPDQQLWDLLIDSGADVYPSIQFTGNSFFCSDEQRQLLPDAARPVAVDMESFAVAQVAARKGVPFLSLRGITDTGSASANEDFYANVRQASRNSARVARRLAGSLG